MLFASQRDKLIIYTWINKGEGPEELELLLPELALKILSPRVSLKNIVSYVYVFLHSQLS